MLSVNNLSFKVGKFQLLNKVSFSAQKGELICILGANGAGKSTLLKCIAQTLKPTEGEIIWNNQKLHTKSVYENAKEKSVLTQHTNVGFEFSVYEIVMMGRYPYFKHIPAQVDINAVNQSLEITELKSYQNKMYHLLSGGEKQRTHIARVFAQLLNDIQSCKLMLLDEPLNNLDIKYQHQTMQSIKNFCAQGNIGIMIIHDINLAALYADKILIMKNGKVLAFGTPHEVISSEILSKVYEVNVLIHKHPVLKIPYAFFNHSINVTSKINV